MNDFGFSRCHRWQQSFITTLSKNKEKKNFVSHSELFLSSSFPPFLSPSPLGNRPERKAGGGGVRGGAITRVDTQLLLSCINFSSFLPSQPQTTTIEREGETDTQSPGGQGKQGTFGLTNTPDFPYREYSFSQPFSLIFPYK